MLEILADHVFSARSQPFVGKDGKPHPVTEQDCINRLIAFLDEKTSDDARSLTEDEVRLLASCLDALKGEVCSIVHKKRAGLSL